MRRTLLLALLTLSGCEDILDAAIPCEVGFPPDLAGAWTLEGEGTRVGCADERLDGDFTIASGDPLDVDQDSGTLSLGSPVPGFSLSGEVRDHCFVAFDVVEDTPDGPITYHFTGDPDAVDGPGIERGTFTGEGPGSCRMTGSYEVTVSQ